MELNSDTAIKDDPEIAAPCNDARDGEDAEATPVPGDVNAAAAATDTDDGQPPKSSSGRKRVPTAAALASSEQAQEAAPGKSKTRQRKKAAETSVVSRTSHGGVKIGGRAVTWVGGAGMPREVCRPCQLNLWGFLAHGLFGHHDCCYVLLQTHQSNLSLIAFEHDECWNFPISWHIGNVHTAS